MREAFGSKVCAKALMAFKCNSCQVSQVSFMSNLFNFALRKFSHLFSLSHLLRCAVTLVHGEMTSIIDSNAHFRSRLQEIGLTAATVTAVENHGVSTLSQLAFSVGQPGQPIADASIDAFLQAALGRAPTVRESASLKRAVFESQTYLIASLRQSVERPEDAPKKVSFAERATRLQALRAALPGISIEGEHDPAHVLLDRVCNMYDNNTLRYLDPATCVSRSHEIQGTTKNRELTFEKGSIVMRPAEDKLSSPTDSEIKVHYAFVRRGLALQFGRLMSYNQHSQWESFLFSAMHREPPPGYARPALAQLLQCDRAAWVHLGTHLADIRQAGDGTYPLGAALLALRHDPNVTLHLAPLAKPVAQSTSTSSSWRPQPYQGSQSRPKGKGKGKKGGGKSMPPVPAELRGKYHKTASGEPICYGYNCASGCSEKNVKPGERCSRGWHVCAEPKCQKAHSLQQHATAS